MYKRENNINPGVYTIKKGYENTHMDMSKIYIYNH